MGQARVRVVIISLARRSVISLVERIERAAADTPGLFFASAASNHTIIDPVLGHP
jgi:hypothetical protein